MGQASVVTRMRTGDIRSVPLTFWLFAILTGLYGYLLVTSYTIEALSYGLSLIPALAPLVFAAAMAWVAPADRRYLWGAAFIAAAELPRLVEMALARFAAFQFDWGVGITPSSLTWGLELIGVALIALAIGGIKERRNWLWPVLGLGVFLIGDIENAAFWASNPYPEEELGFVYPPLLIAVSFVAGLTIVAWSYLLGAAVEHGRRLFAVGAGIFVALSAFGLFDELIYGLFPPTISPAVSPFFLALTVVNAVAWVAMILGALREVPRRNAPAEAAY